MVLLRLEARRLRERRRPVRYIQRSVLRDRSIEKDPGDRSSSRSIVFGQYKKQYITIYRDIVTRYCVIKNKEERNKEHLARQERSMRMIQRILY